MKISLSFILFIFSLTCCFANSKEKDFAPASMMPQMAPNEIELGVKSKPTVRQFEDREYVTNTESDWGAKLRFFKDSKLKVEITAQDANDPKPITRSIEGTWKINKTSLVVMFENSEVKFAYHPKSSANWFIGKTDVLVPINSNSKNLLKSTRLFGLPLKRK